MDFIIEKPSKIHTRLLKSTRTETLRQFRQNETRNPKFPKSVEP
ncbi:hypothetical protein COLO4_25908 [Corchorus olitorius]|uniref:Uncharacterized protein n=1 Tax=Corchorus olitorius TaxID=93759 RepID=A0A1R3HZG4_9ROSI|nr:hypothetical protein COLO4_25908 [Corchorus olitorius]